MILNSWIFDGELVDHFSEFIISCDLSSKPEKLWRSKYKLRKAMVPSFISEDLAEKVSGEWSQSSGFEFVISGL